MKGLLLKELYTFRKNWLVMLIFLGTAVLNGILIGNVRILMIIPLLLSVWSVNFMNADEISKWQQYSIILPYGRKTIVSSKYLIIMILNICSLVIVSVCYALSSAVGKAEFSKDSLLMLMISSIVVGFLYPIVALPLNFRFNFEKGRQLIVIVNFLISGAIIILITMTKDIISIPEKITVYILLIIAAAITIFFVLSWLLSVKIYEKKDL